MYDPPSVTRLTPITFTLIFPACFAEPSVIDSEDDDDDPTTGAVVSTGDASTGTANVSSGPDSSGSPPGGSTTGGSTSADTSGESGGRSTGRPRVDPCIDATHTFFVNFDGVTLSAAGVDDATADETSIVGGDSTWAAFVGPDRDEVFAIVVDTFAPFDVCITDVRPSSGDYAMVVVTPDPHPTGALAFALEDCNDSEDREVALVVGPITSYGTDAKGYVIAATIGTLLGLGFVTDAPDDVMKTVIDTNESGLAFTDVCHPLDPAVSCFPTTCEGDSQSSVEYLESTVGLAR